MLSRTLAVTVLLVSAAAPIRAQDASPTLSGTDTELLDNTLELRFGCDPMELAAAEGSSFSASIGGESVEGHAVWGVERDGDLILILGKFEGTGGQCLVWASHDGPPEVGTWPVVALSPALMNGELEGRHFAGGWFAKVDTIGHTLVPDSGTLVFTSLESGKLTGSFMLDGWTVTEGEPETGRLRIEGTFVAVEPK